MNEPLHLRTTDLKNFFKCPRFFEYEKFQKIPEEENIHLQFGKLFAYSMEFLTKGKSLEEVVKWLCQQDLPQGEKKNLPSLLRSVIWYSENYQGERFTTLNEFTEKEFTIEILPNVFLSSLFDRVVEFQGETYILDQKTTGLSISPSFLNNYLNDPQVNAYLLVANRVLERKVAGLIIDAVSVQKEVTSFGRFTIRKTQDELEDFQRTLQLAIGSLRAYKEAEYFPMNLMSCGQMGGCSYLRVCTAPYNIRKTLLNTQPSGETL